jgi:23S rRNA (guanine745-N1)-methyltransferase
VAASHLMTDHLSSPPLACPVRDCHLPLDRNDAEWRCPHGHSFDVARSGYVNLLQPQDRRSRAAGDPRTALSARSRLLAAGIGRTVLEAFVARAEALLPQAGGTVVDLGCGSGDALGLLRTHRDRMAIGIDLAAVAVDAAARRFPSITWVVANADRRLPLLETRVSLMVSLHARRNPDECRRVLEPGGHLLVAVPAPDDLIELREAVQGTRLERDRVAAVIAEHESSFEVVDRATAREHHHMSGEPLHDLLRGTYRGERTSASERVQAITDLGVTLASDFLVLRRR